MTRYLSSLRPMVQSLALRAYQAPLVQRVLDTRTGRSLFEWSYFRYKDWIEAPSNQTLAAYLRPGTWAIDVGANIGYFTEKFAGWVTQGGRVVAMEPEAANFARLKARLAKLGVGDRVTAMHGAAADRDGEWRLAVKSGHPGDHSLSDDGEVPVQVWRLDTVWRDLGEPPVGLLKIDVQGAEMCVLMGAQELLRRCSPAVLIEIDDMALRTFGTTPADVLTWLAGRGYALHWAADAARRAVEPGEIVRQVAGPPPTYCDVLALPPAHRLSGANAD